MKIISVVIGLIFLFHYQNGFSSESKNERQLRFRIVTTMGNIEGKLFYQEAPQTVSNFVTLARSGYYDGIIFHRVIPRFMVQTGDPIGNGTGGPGYTFADEFHPKLRHDKAGILSMANAGPNTNGSQFFITVAPTPHLDNRHSVFGEVTSGLDVAIKISNVATKQDAPLVPIKMNKVEILGEWYTPDKVKKMLVLQEKELIKLLEPKVKILLQKLAEAEELGKTLSFRFKYSAIQGRRAQVFYTASFEKLKTANLIVVGEENSGAFIIKQLQFAKE